MMPNNCPVDGIVHPYFSQMSLESVIGNTIWYMVQEKSNLIGAECLVFVFTFRYLNALHAQHMQFISGRVVSIPLDYMYIRVTAITGTMNPASILLF